MAFAAIHPDVGRVDATLPDMGCGISWAEVHKARPRIALRCPDCGHGVHAKVSARKLRYFAHDPGRPPDCAWLSESLEHHLLKLELATAIRSAGWYAELETRAPDGSWRADVLAASHDGSRRFAWEAQLSPISREDITERTDRYHDEDIAVCWVSPAGRVPWIGAVPSIRVREPGGDHGWIVIDGTAGFSYDQGTWATIENLELPLFTRWVLHEQLAIHQPLPRYRRVWIGADQGYGRRRLIWTTSRSVGDETRHEAMRQRQEERKRQREEDERLTAQRRKEEDEARQREERRQREEKQAAEHARWKEQWDAQRRQAAIEAEQARQRQEAQERQRREAAIAAEQERLRQVERERQAARLWWAGLSLAQIQQLRDAVAGPIWKKEAIHAEFDPGGPAQNTAYGIAVYLRQRLHCVLRPSPASLHRLPPDIPVIARNAREAQQIIATGQVDRTRVTHFDLPDEEQMTLI